MARPMPERLPAARSWRCQLRCCRPFRSSSLGDRMRNPASAVTYCLTFASLSKTDAHQQARRQERQWPLPRPTPPWRPSSPRSAAIQETARAFAMKEVLPVANKLDPEKGDIPPELLQKLADMGYFGIVIPEQYGGLGLGVFEYCLITEELARAWMSVASIIARGNGLSAGRGMTDASARATCRALARGEFLGAAAMSEPDVGSDLGNIACRARADGDELGDQRQQILVHLRRRRRLHHAGRAHRPTRPIPSASMSALLLPDREAARHVADGRQGRADSQDRLFRLEDLGARLRRLPPAGSSADRRGRPRLLLHLRPAWSTARAHTAARAIGLARGALEDATAYAQERRAVRPGRSATSRRSASSSPTWRPRSRPRAQLMYFVCDEIDRSGAATRRRRW